MKKKSEPTQLVCLPKRLTKAQTIQAAHHAIEANPMNRPPVERMRALGVAASPLHIAVMATAYWGTSGVQLTVGFLDTAETALKKRILGHMNAWNKNANVTFTLTDHKDTADVRISRVGGKNGGYWPYVGTQIKTIPKGEATMNLEAFTMRTDDNEFLSSGPPRNRSHARVCARAHEAGAGEADRPSEGNAYFLRNDGWDEQETIDQVLTPIEDATIKGTDGGS